jgi:hypothetical protein
MENRMITRLLFLILNTAIISSVDAQIAHTEISPNQVVSNSNFTIDMNNDGVVDFTIKQTTGVGVEIEIPTGNGVVIPQTPPGFAAVLNCQTNVSSTNNFYIAGGAVPMNAYGVGYWSGASGKCLGVKFNVGSNTFFGWIRLDVSSTGNSATVIDYAYNTVVGQSINTCDVGSSLGIETMNLTDQSFKVYPTYFENQISIETSQPLKCQVLNYLGNVVQEFVLESPKTTIEFGNVSPGTYFLNFSDSFGNKTVQKVIKMG